MEKAELVAAFEELLRERLERLRAEAGAARSGTRVDGSHRPANRGERAAVTSQGYLALGLGKRIEALEADLGLLEQVPAGPRTRVGPGALVEVEEDEVRRLLILPGGSGDRVAGVVVVSPRSPLARALAGAEAGEVVELEDEDEERELEVLSVC